MEDKPRTDLGEAEDKKDLRRAAYRGKVQFYHIVNVKLAPMANFISFWSFQSSLEH